MCPARRPGKHIIGILMVNVVHISVEVLHLVKCKVVKEHQKVADYQCIVDKSRTNSNNVGASFGSTLM